MKNLLTNLLEAIQAKLDAYKVVLTDVQNENETSIKVLTKGIMDRASEWTEKMRKNLNIEGDIEVVAGYESMPIFRINYGEGDRKRANDVELVTKTNWETGASKITKAGWFSTSESPTVENRLVDYLKVLTFVNEAIVKRDGQIEWFERMSNKISKLAREISSAQSKVESLQKDIDFVTTFMRIFNLEKHFNKAVIERTSVEDLKKIATELNIRYVSKAGFYNEIMDKINTLLLRNNQEKV